MSGFFGSDTLDFAVIDAQGTASAPTSAVVASNLFCPPTGGPGDDLLIGGAAGDSLDGKGGNDTVLGQAGNDTLIGGDGNDALEGGAGIDLMRGGPGVDVLTGGADIDGSVFAIGDGQLTVTDFVPGWTSSTLPGWRREPRWPIWHLSFPRTARMC